MFYFKGKVVWITGASSGIGEAMARILDAAGARLILSGRNEELLQKIAGECRSEPKTLSFDISNMEEINDVAEKAISLYGNIDVLINNAGQGCRSNVMDTNLDTDRRIMDVNYFGNIALTKALLPHFVSRNSGQIIVVSSLAGKFGTKSRSSYAASKHALHGFYESLLMELYDEGIRVCIACPGFVETSFLDRSWKGDGSRVGSISKDNKRMTAEECASQILKAAARQKKEVIIGQSLKERATVHIKNLFPGIFFKALKATSVS